MCPARILLSFFFPYSRHHRDLPSFPTRRSSDLVARHDAAPGPRARSPARTASAPPGRTRQRPRPARPHRDARPHQRRSEEHTSELQSPYDLVCRLLLEKKKKRKYKTITNTYSYL